MSGEQWAIVEIVGHRRHVGLTSEVVRYGITMLLVEAVIGGDINERRTHLYPGSSIFGVSPITEEEAKKEVAPYTPVARQLPAAEMLEEWFLKVDGVEIERHERTAGWVLFSGCGGDDPTLRAFFPGRRGKDLATIVLAAKDDAEPDQPLLFDGAIAPAFLDEKGGLYVANNGEPEGVRALAKKFDVSPGTWGEAFAVASALLEKDDAPDSQDW